MQDLKWALVARIQAAAKDRDHQDKWLFTSLEENAVRDELSMSLKAWADLVQSTRSSKRLFCVSLNEFLIQGISEQID